MSYRIRFTLPDGRTGLWAHDYQTRETAQAAIDDRLADTGFAYTVEEVAEPGSTAAHHVEILRARVKEMEEVQRAMHRDLAFALQIGDAMREAMRTGEWRAGHDRSMASSAIAGWDRWKESLAASRQGTAKASEAPEEGGDSDRRRLEVLNDWIRGGHRAFGCQNGIVVALDGLCLRPVVDAPTLAALADKLAEKEAKP